MSLINDLMPLLEQEVHCSEWFEITQQQIDDFARVTLDNQWLHTDVERTQRESPFGGTIAHGFYILSMFPYLRGMSTGEYLYPGVEQAINYGINKLRFINPVRPGARLQAVSVLKDVTETPMGVQIVEQLTIHIEGEGKLALAGELVLLLIPKGDGADGRAA